MYNNPNDGWTDVLSAIFAVAMLVALILCILNSFWVSLSALAMAMYQMQGGKGDFRNIDGAGAVVGLMAIFGFISSPPVFLMVWFCGIYISWKMARRTAGRV